MIFVTKGCNGMPFYSVSSFVSAVSIAAIAASTSSSVSQRAINPDSFSTSALLCTIRKIFAIVDLEHPIKYTFINISFMFIYKLSYGFY